MEVHLVLWLLFLSWLRWSLLFAGLTSIAYITLYYLHHVGTRVAERSVKWWAVLSGVFWVFVGTSYFTLEYYSYRDVPYMVTTGRHALIFGNGSIVLIVAAVILLWWWRRLIRARVEP